MVKLFWQINTENINKFRKYVSEEGLKTTVTRVYRYLDDNRRYQKWLAANLVSEEELQKQKETVFEYAPLISLIVPVFNTPADYLKAMIDSVINQSYSNWELCIADGSTQGHEASEIVKEYSEKDHRVRFCTLDQNYGISGNTNKALEMVQGEYTSLFDHDDVLEPDCLFEIVKSLQETRHDVIYTDEDKLYSEKGIYQTPNFKPDYSPDLLNSQNYITHFFTVKTDIINAIGGFRSAFDGSQDYDLIFRCIEKAQSVHHIAKILYHWRMHAASTALNPESKMYCYEAGQKAIQEHYDRTGIDADVYMMPAPYYGNYHTVYRMKETPLVSVIIRNTGDVETLKRCIHSIRDFGSYKNIEVITVSQPETDAVNEEGVKDVIWLEDPQKHSAMLNYGASFANGKYLLFVSDSAEMIKADSIREMAALLSREETGAVGAKLLDGDQRVRHAGIIIGFDGYAENVFAGERRNSEGYVMRNLVSGNYSAVSGDCLMTKTSLFKELGGFDEAFEKEAYDLDYCLRVREKELLVTYCAFSEWYVTQDAETETADRERFCEKWKETIAKNDPYYNPCLALKGKPFRI